MGWFKSKYERELDIMLERIRMNMSNNYKDAAQLGLKEYEDRLNELKQEGKLKDSAKANYESLLDDYKHRLQGFTHKDQKPYWT